MTRKSKILLICLASITALLIFIVAILPVIVRNQAVEAIEKETGRKAHIGTVSINPFTLTVTVKDFSIEALKGGRFIAAATLRASLGLSSIYRRALIISEVTIDAPAISFTRMAANSYNFNDIVEHINRKPKSKSKSTVQFSINNISITNGSLDFYDQAVSGGRKHTIRNLKVAVPFISNIPFLVEKYTDPHISALVNGAPFSFTGKVKPLSKSMETSVHIDFNNLNLPEYVAYIPTKLPADIASGSLSINTDITYRIHSDKKPQLHIKGLMRMEDIAVNLKNGKPLLKVPHWEAQASLLEVLAGKYAFDSIIFNGLELFASRNANGEWIYSQLLSPTPRELQKTEPDAAKNVKHSNTGNIQVQVSNFSFNNGMVHFNDALPAGGFKSEISQIDATVRNFSTAADTSAEYDVSLLVDNEATFSADGRFSLTPLTAHISSELSDLKIQRAWPYLRHYLTAPLKGTVELSSEIAFSKELGLTVDQGSLLVTGLSTRYGDKEGFDLARLEINEAGFKQKENLLEIGGITLSKGDLSLSREANGTISALSLFTSPQAKPVSGTGQNSLPVPAAPALSETIGSSQQQPPAPKFSYRIKKLQIEKFNTAFTDKSIQDKPRFTLNNTMLSVSNLNGPQFTPAGLRFTSTFNKATPLKASGDITPLPFRYRGNIAVGRLPLRDFEAYFPSNINVFLLSGFADADMTVDIALKNGKPFGSFKGNSGIRALHAIDTVSEEDLLKWESLQLDDLQGNLEPFSLALHQIALNSVYSRIIIRKDGTLNLQNLVETPVQGNAPSASPPAVTALRTLPPSPAQQSAPAQKQIKIDAITIQDGTISFTDNHLPQRFATTFFNLGGRVSGLTSDESKLADVDLRGNLENHSPLQITGQINPLRNDLFVDLKISFRDIELSPITPYSSRFLGYTVEKGKLFLDLKYHIDKKQLDSENNVFIDQFTFGEKVESDKATNLPVKLGLALLKDRKGEIHLDLPVTGRTDDPKFSLWGVVWQVLQNVLVKAATSPFALLSSMFGGGQDFSVIQFATGTSILSLPEEQKLTALAKALLERPALKVELKGYVDRGRDTEGYRNAIFSHKLKNEKFFDLSKSGMQKEGEKADSLQIQPEEYARYLAAVYKKEKFPKPRNVLGLVKELPPDEMKKLIITNTFVGDPELQTLVRERILAVKNYLVTSGKVPPERIFEKNDDIFKTPEKETTSRSRVELNAIVQ
jgi:hypothetical protein